MPRARTRAPTSSAASHRPPGHGQAAAELTRALLALADRRERPRCAEEPQLWAADNAADRRSAAAACAGCPIATPCLEAALEAGDRHTVRAGRDLADARVRARLRTPQGET